MSCTHNCGCTEQNRDASLDEWPTTAWLQGRAAKEASEDASEAPQEVQLAPEPSEPVFIDPSTLAPRKRVEVDWPSGTRCLYYVDEGGYQIIAGRVGNGHPLPWEGARIVRVLTEDKPSDTEAASALPGLPRPIAPEDVRAGMVVERRNGECYIGGRVESIDGSGIWLGKIAIAWIFGAKYAERGWSLWLIEDAPAPVDPDPADPDAGAIEVMARVVHDQQCADNWDRHGEGTQRAWRDDARDILATLRATHDVTPRAEQ